MRNAVILVCLLLLGFLLGMPSPALAFNITLPDVHQDITKQVLENYHVDGVDGRFSNDAIQIIVQANRSVDNNQNDSALHFDNENFIRGGERVKKLKEEIIARVQEALASGSTATQAIHTRLGQALHTVQDFYAHSNWVELQNQENNGDPMINKELGRGEISNVADENTPTCPTDASILGGAGLKQLTSGYYKNAASCSLPDGINPGKCIHGPLLNLSCSGINKDKPGRRGYETAKALAVKATEDYLDQILKEGPLAGNVDAAKFLMKISRK